LDEREERADGRWGLSRVLSLADVKHDE